MVGNSKSQWSASMILMALPWFDSKYTSSPFPYALQSLGSAKRPHRGIDNSGAFDNAKKSPPVCS